MLLKSHAAGGRLYHRLQRFGHFDLGIDHGLLDAAFPVIAELLAILGPLVGVDDRPRGVDQCSGAVGATELDELGTFMRSNPNTYAVVAGFTDSAGDEEYNTNLSKLRAENVAIYLYQNHNIDISRMVVLWYGPFNPIDSNETKAGRARNRRVEIAVGSFD